MSERPTLSAPGDLAGFPAVRAPARLHRICRSENGTWWFSSDGSGRFDLERPEGTCYFATDLYAAVREATRLGPVTPQWMADREVRVVALPDPKPRLAATTRKEAGRFGMTTELVTLVPYDLSRRWGPLSGIIALAASAISSGTTREHAPSGSPFSVRRGRPAPRMETAAPWRSVT